MHVLHAGIVWMAFAAGAQAFHLAPGRHGMLATPSTSVPAVRRWAPAPRAAPLPAAADDEDDPIATASERVSELLDAGDDAAAQAVLAALTAEDVAEAYALAVADAALSSQFSVAGLKSLRSFAAIVLGQGGELVTGHASSVELVQQFLAMDEDMTFDDKLRTGGSLLALFMCLYPEPVDELFLEDGPEARACARYLNMLDPEIRQREARKEVRRLLTSELDAQLMGLAACVEDDFDEKLEAFEAEIPALFQLLRADKDDACQSLQTSSRSAFGKMVASACRLVRGGEKAGAVSLVERLLDTSRLVLFKIGEFEFEEEGAWPGYEDLVESNLNAIALSETSRDPLYAEYARAFVLQVLRENVDMEAVESDMCILKCLLSQNTYVARDANTEAYISGLEVAVLQWAEDSGSAAATPLPNTGKAGGLIRALDLADVTEEEARRDALVRVSQRLMVDQRMGRDQVGFACTLLDLPDTALAALIQKEDRNKLQQDVVELVDRFVNADASGEQTEVANRLKLIVQDHSSFGVTLEATCALVEEVIQTKLASTVHESFAAEEVGDMPGTKKWLQSTTKLPELLAALADEQPQISTDVSLQDVLTEDEELKLSDFCWELEESMDVENEQLATRILQLLGMKR